MKKRSTSTKRKVKLPSLKAVAKQKKESQEMRTTFLDEEDERRMDQQEVESFAKNIIKKIYDQDEWPKNWEDWIERYNNEVILSGCSANTAKQYQSISHDDLLKWAKAAIYKKKQADEEKPLLERERRTAENREKKEKELQKLCRDFGICSAAALAGMGVAAVVGGPVIPIGAITAGTIALAKQGGLIGGRTRRKKRQRKSKSKSRRKKRKKRKTRRLRRKSRLK